MYAISSGDESDTEPMSIDMLEEISDGSQSHPSINSREACYNIRDCIKRGQLECKGELLSTINLVKVFHKVFKDFLMRFHKLYQFLVNLDQKFLTLFQNLKTFQK